MEKLQISFETPLRVILAQEEAPQPPRAIFTVQIEGLTFKGENMSNTMGVGTYATVSVEWKDKGGNVVGVEKGSVQWASSAPDTCQVTQAAGNPQIANLYAPGPIGKVQVHATGDADLGAGVQSITASIDVEVIGGQAVGGEIKFTQNPAQGNPPPGKGTPPAGQRR